jgi:hypothetical protein
MNDTNAEQHTINHMKRTTRGCRSPSRTRIAILVIGLATFGLGSTSIQIAYAAPPVNVSCDENDLIRAIANDHADVLSLAGQCIYTLTVVNNQDPVLGDNGLPVIKRGLTIVGNGAVITRRSTKKFRIFEVAQGGDLTINDLTVDNGDAAGDGLRSGEGGGVFNFGGTLTVNRSTFSHNHANSFGGGIGNGDGAEIDPSQQVGGTLNLNERTVLSENSSGNSGGAIANGAKGKMTLKGCSVSHNTSGGGGGGIASQGDGATVTNSNIILGNTAALGGGIAVGLGSFTLDNSWVGGNIATAMTGDPSTGYGGGIVNLVDATTRGYVQLKNSTVADNIAPNGGGGITNLGKMDITNSDIIRNTADHDGGGIANIRLQGTPGDAAQLTLKNSLVKNNRASHDGGGIINVHVPGNPDVAFATASLTGSNVISNRAGDHGGGIFYTPLDTVNLSNSNVTDNYPDDCYSAACSGRPSVLSGISAR